MGNALSRAKAIVLLSVALFHCGCGQYLAQPSAKTTETSIARTQEALQSLLSGPPRRQADGRVSVRDLYCTRAYQRGLKLLDDPATSYSDPVVLTAVIESTDASPMALVVHWLSATSNVKGVFIQDTQGAMLCQGELYVPDAKVTDADQELLRYGIARLDPEGKSDFPVLQVNIERLSRDVLVGVISKDGTFSKPIKPFIDDGLRLFDYEK